MKYFFRKVLRKLKYIVLHNNFFLSLRIFQQRHFFKNLYLNIFRIFFPKKYKRYLIKRLNSTILRHDYSHNCHYHGKWDINKKGDTYWKHQKCTPICFFKNKIGLARIVIRYAKERGFKFVFRHAIRRFRR